MIKKKVGINCNEALKEACENNDIVLTEKGVNLKPVSYIDLKGEKIILNAKFSVNDMMKAPKIRYHRKDTEFHAGDVVKVYCQTAEEYEM